MTNQFIIRLFGYNSLYGTDYKIEIKNEQISSCRDEQTSLNNMDKTQNNDYSCKFFILILALIVWSFLHRDLVSQDDPVQIPTFKVAANNE